MQKRIKHELSFSVVPLTDPYTLVVQDTSVYRSDAPQNPVLSLTLPSGDVRDVPFKPGETNVISSYSMGYEGSAKLQDGVYRLEYSVAPNDRTRVCEHYLKADQAECTLIQWVAEINWEGLDGCSTPHRTLNQLHALLLGARANARIGYVDRAKHQFELFHKLLCTTHLPS